MTEDAEDVRENFSKRKKKLQPPKIIYLRVSPYLG